MTSAAVHVPPPVVAVNSSGASSGAAERCLMHLKRMLCATQKNLDSSQNHIVVQHDDAHAIIVLHVDASSCTPIVGGGIALDSLHCAAQVRHHSIHSLTLFLFSFNYYFFVLTSFSVHAPVTVVSFYFARVSLRCLIFLSRRRRLTTAFARRLHRSYQKQRHEIAHISCRSYGNAAFSLGFTAVISTN
jgi:hypothetical protein